MSRVWPGAVVLLALACGDTDVVGTLLDPDAGQSGSGGHAGVGGAGGAGNGADAGGAGAAATAGTAGSGATGGVGGQAGSSGSAGIGGSAGGTGMDGHARLCSGAGDTNVCGASLARVFDHALCTCTDASGTGDLVVNSRRSDGRGAAVGINGSLGLRLQALSLSNPQPGLVAGAIHIGDPGPVPLAGAIARVGGDLRLQGSLTFAGSIDVEGSVYSRELPTGTGMLRIAGDLITAPSLPGLPGGGAGGGGTLLPTHVSVAGAVRSESYPFTPPCACDGDPSAPILAALSNSTSDNDNAQLGVSTNALSAIAGAHSLSLDCGRVRFDSVGVLGDLHVTVRGHSVWWVAGDFLVGGDVNVTLEGDAQLDVFIGGRLGIDGHARFCDALAPGRCRVHVAGSMAVGARSTMPLIDTPLSLVGNFYAPTATLQLPVDTQLSGALFVQQVLALQRLQIDHDPVVASRGGACDAR